MRDIKIEESPIYESSIAHIYIKDIENDVDLVWLGCDIQTYNSHCQSHDRLPQKYKDMENPICGYYHEMVEELLTHETLHFILHRIDGGRTSNKLDNIDFPTKRLLSINSEFEVKGE